MPTARKLPSGNWRCKIYLYKDSDGKEHYKSFTAKTKKEAEFLAIQYANQIHKDGEEQTFEEVYRFMTELKKPSISPNTHRGLVRDIDSSYFDSVRNMPINKIDDVMVQKMINEWIARGLSPKTIRNKYVNFRSAIRTVYKHKDFDIIMPDKEKPDIYIPTDEEMKKILDTARNTPVEMPILLAAFMGMRRSEIEALVWSDVDMNARTIAVIQSVAIDADNNKVLKKPKSTAGKRTVVMPDIVAEALYRHQNDDTVRVVPLTGAGIYKRFKTILRHAGVNDFRFHDLRHYYASVMLSLSVPDKYAMELMGHATPSTLKNVYQHTMQNKKEEIASALNAHFSGNF